MQRGHFNMVWLVEVVLSDVLLLDVSQKVWKLDGRNVPQSYFCILQAFAACLDAIPPEVLMNLEQRGCGFPKNVQETH